ncbi:Kiwa anti-phage protein KwaB-like domain-containing protein [Bordetella genomosp. 13]|uniref:Kiwa anti-phage protein KwaB-like domain-containing protein n=1 Tax=Bordetella genomosp. 13 TaxID=463040 RepID=UPI00164318B6|nr:Kiwa anti-phage protein KwaB-like domain-containing protein [Bordetella genomosp. 13]
MSLFALTSLPGSRILRLVLTAALQEDIRRLFTEQLAAFETGIVDTIPFDGRYAPDEGELLSIDGFHEAAALRDAVAHPVSVEAYDPARHALDGVRALFSGVGARGAERVLIQRFERRRLISNRGLAILYSGNTFRRMEQDGLTLDTKLLAVLDGDTLRFQSFHFLRQVFDLSAQFNEATNEDVQRFATHAKIAVEDPDAFLEGAGTLVRKKIALILQSGLLENYSTQQIAAAAQEFDLTVQVDAKKRIVLPDNKTALRRLLHFLDEDYYTSPISRTRYVSNSKRVAD